MRSSITDLSKLEAIIGKAPALVHLKAIDHLDEGALRWVAASPLMFAAFGDAAKLDITLGAGEPGWARGDSRQLQLPAAMLDNAVLAKPGLGFGSLFTLPSISEVLRVNGRVAAVTASEITVTVNECYFHCGKALLRSEFWAASPDPAAAQDPADFVPASRFMALATTDAHGHADVSPKGDMPGTMAQLDDGILWFADRPGNKRIDSFRNIITQPRVAAMLLIPGSTHIVYLSGTARITDDDAIRARFVVQDKTPALATGIDELTIDIRDSPALARAHLWPASAPPEGINPGKIVTGHLKLNKSIAAKLAGAVASAVPGLMQRELEKDYKKNIF